jgi:hypothetical protein
MVVHLSAQMLVVCLAVQMLVVLLVRLVCFFFVFFFDFFVSGILLFLFWEKSYEQFFLT